MKIMSFNTQHCLNFIEQKIDYKIMADTIKKCDADVVALNEIFNNAIDFCNDDQTAALSQLTGLKYHYFAKAVDIYGKNPYGNALLSKYPIISAKTVPIPDPKQKKGKEHYETRCLLKAKLENGITVLVVHFGLNRDEQENAVKVVLKNLEEEKCILMGDFNVTPENDVLNPIRAFMKDTADTFNRPLLSFPSDNPDRKIDYIFVTQDIDVLNADIPEIVASDHRPHVATLNILLKEKRGYIMTDIAELDRNFEIKTNIDKEDIRFYSADKLPFKVYGVYRENDRYCRLPEVVAKKVNSGVHEFYDATAGGRVRFITDSSYVAIYANMDKCIKGSHFAVTGCSGFDLYVNDSYAKTFIPPFDVTDNYERIVEFKTNEIREITINFPLYSAVRDLHIGLEESATIKEAPPYKNNAPVVYYGSSITQGGCASRPGSCYEAIISRRFNIDYINLGFSGSARGEDEIANYIKDLDMSLFVYDYDYNAPSVEHLQNTHERMFKIIRNANPTLPIIIMSRPKYYLEEDEKERLNIIETTYKKALSEGDNNVYLIRGSELVAACKNEGTVDGAHPTDYGFACMAQVLGDFIEKNEIIS